MKRAVFLHSTDGSTTDNWWPWLRRTLEDQGYEIFAPSLPGNHTPNKIVYEKFLRNSGWDFTDNVLIGHSSGATTILNLLSEDWFPKARAIALVGTFLNEKWTKTADWYEQGQFDGLFLKKYDANKIKQKTNKVYFVHGDNDPFCDIEDARELCAQLDGKFLVIKNGHHLGDSSGITELPELAKALRNDGVI